MLSPLTFSLSSQAFPGLESFTFNNVERVPAGTILQFVRLIERVRRTMAYEYGLDLAKILPLQTYSRKYVAGQSQQGGGGGGGEGDHVILHTDESTHTSYHYSCVIYLNTQGEDFEGGDFIFNDPKEGYEEPPRAEDDDDEESGYGNEPGVSLAEVSAIDISPLTSQRLRRLPHSNTNRPALST